MNSGRPKTVEPWAASYRAEQVPGAVIILGHGIHPTSGYEVFFEQSLVDVFPAQFSLWHVKPSGIILEVLTPFAAQTSFKAPEKVKVVVVYDANGKHEVPVEQVPDLVLSHAR